jgi:hypothetical protein
MATLYVENVPDDRYEALREEAKKNRTSIAAVVIELLERFIPTKKELEERQRFLEMARRMSNSKPLTPGPFPSAEEMIREDRDR